MHRVKIGLLRPSVHDLVACNGKKAYIAMQTLGLCFDHETLECVKVGVL